MLGPAVVDAVVGDGEFAVADGVYGGKLPKHIGGRPLDPLVQPGPRSVIRPSCRGAK